MKINYFFFFANIFLFINIFLKSKLSLQRAKLETYHEYLYKLNKYKNNKYLIDENKKLKLKNIIIYSKKNDDKIFIPKPIKTELKISADTYARNKLLKSKKIKN